jgi:hypothetical protein
MLSLMASTHSLSLHFPDDFVPLPGNGWRHGRTEGARCIQLAIPTPPTHLILDAVKISGFVVEKQVFSPLI